MMSFCRASCTSGARYGAPYITYMYKSFYSIYEFLFPEIHRGCAIAIAIMGRRPPGFFWLFAIIGELVSNNEQALCNDLAASWSVSHVMANEFNRPRRSRVGVTGAWREVCHVGCPYRVGYYYANVFSTEHTIE